MQEIFLRGNETIIKTDEEEYFDELEQKYELENLGKSGEFLGYTWYSDEKNDVSVYYKYVDERMKREQEEWENS